MEVSYADASPSDYPAEQRCNVLRGPRFPNGTVGYACENPDRKTVDNVAVVIRYRHVWATPLNALFSFFGGGDVKWDIEQRNIFRMEPVK